MTGKDRYLYHQIHPAKLAADVAAAIIGLWLLWRHDLAPALAVLLILPALASALLLRFGELEPQKRSAFGHYVARFMTRGAEAVRLAGMALMGLGAWLHRPVLIVAGAAIILSAWLRGLFVRR